MTISTSDPPSKRFKVDEVLSSRRELQESSPCDSLKAVIQYNIRPPSGKPAGLFVPKTAAEVPGSGFVLRWDVLRLQHGCVPLRLEQEHRDDITEEKLQQLFSNANHLVPVNVNIHNARLLDKVPTLGSHGFQLLQGLPLGAIVAANDGALAESCTASTVVTECYRDVEAAVTKATGASVALAFCHARRTSSNEIKRAAAGAGFAMYAHTDNSAESWSVRMKELLEHDSWKRVGPPGLSEEVACRAAKARRYAVVSAWRYLGPEECCRSSHLAVLDHSTVKSEDVIDFYLVSGEHKAAGGNYRLAAPSIPKEQGEYPVDHPHHRWYYFPDMARDEALMFTVFDSSPSQASPSFGTMPIPTLFHSAFMDPSPLSKLQQARESIDIRCLCIWD